MIKNFLIKSYLWVHTLLYPKFTVEDSLLAQILNGEEEWLIGISNLNVLEGEEYRSAPEIRGIILGKLGTVLKKRIEVKWQFVINVSYILSLYLVSYLLLIAVIDDRRLYFVAFINYVLVTIASSFLQKRLR